MQEKRKRKKKKKGKNPAFSSLLESTEVTRGKSRAETVTPVRTLQRGRLGAPSASSTTDLESRVCSYKGLRCPLHRTERGECRPFPGPRRLGERP